MGSDETATALIVTYFYLGFAYQEILEVLAHRHGTIVSKRTLHRILRCRRLYRRKQKSDILDVSLFVMEQLHACGSLYGYRWMHSTCIRNGFVVSRDDIRLLLSVLDVEGVHQRSAKKLRRRQYHSKGPNSCWHIDGYDKLKPYGLCISGAIDGFSRRVMWLSVFKTNNNPKVIAGYYMETLKKIGGAPSLIRADMGTENGLIEVIHTSLVGANSFRYGRSTSNQRIECWWSFLRKNCVQFWMNVLEDMSDEGLFNGDLLDKSLIQYCFTDVLQDSLDEVVLAWNSHRIRPSSNQRVPHGRPDIMYNIPQLYAVQDFKHRVTDADLDICNEECVFRLYSCDRTVYNLCEMYMVELQLERPANAEQARELYVNLREQIKNDLSTV